MNGKRVRLDIVPAGRAGPPRMDGDTRPEAIGLPRAALWLAAAVLCLPGFRAQSRAAGAQQSATTQIEEVVVDVVARDRNGNPVTDVELKDVEIEEDGVKQEITGLRRVSLDNPAAAASEDPLQDIKLVTMVFQNQYTSPDGQSVARRAVDEFLKIYGGGNIVVGMFTLDKRLCIVQQYTNRKEYLAEAIDRAVNQDYEPLQRSSDSIQKSLAAIGSGAASGTSEHALGGTGNPALDARLAQISTRMLEGAAPLATDQGGWRTVVYSLQSLAREAHLVPGRKTLFYFAWGLWVDREHLDQVQQLQSIANQAHVSIYPVYLAGLSTWSQARDAAAALKDAAAASRSETGTGAVGTWGVRAGQAGESAITANALEALTNLGKSTAGVLMGDSNDFREPMEAAYRDISNYYLISYRPRNAQYDGKYRKIEVKIRGVKTVLARNGYLASPPSAESPAGTSAEEAPLMALLNEPAAPSAFEFRARAFHFDSSGGATRNLVMLEVPAAALALAEDPSTKKLRGHIVLLALVKDAGGSVIARVSESFPLETQQDRLEGFKKSDILLSREIRLPAGKYTLESAAWDKVAEKGTAVKAPLEVPAGDGVLAVSSLNIIRRVNAASPKDADVSSPFHLGDRKIVPHIEDPVTLKVGTPLTMYFLVYPGAGNATPPKMKLQILRAGSILAEVPAELPAPDPQGRIRYTGTLPTANFAPGSYDLKVIISQGQATAESGIRLSMVR